jgi:hypothetical protein
MKPHRSSWSLVFDGPRASARIYRNAPRKAEPLSEPRIYAAVPKALMAARKNAERRAVASEDANEHATIPLPLPSLRIEKGSLEPLRGATEREVDELLEGLESPRPRPNRVSPKFRRSALILPPTRASSESPETADIGPSVHLHAMTRPSIARHETLLDKVIVVHESGVTPRRRRRDLDTTVTIPRVDHVRARQWLGFARSVFFLGLLFAVAAIAFAAGRS